MLLDRYLILHAFLALLAALLLASAPLQQTHGKPPSTSIVGQWKITSIATVHSSESPKNQTIIATNESISFTDGDDFFTLRLTTDVSVEPNKIDLSWQDADDQPGWTIKGIFKIERNVLVMCLADECDGSIVCGPIERITSRPKTFNVKEGQLITASRHKYRERQQNIAIPHGLGVPPLK